MTAVVYPRSRIETMLAQTPSVSCYRIIPRRYLTLPLGTAPGDSRFCAKLYSYTVLYAAPDFATAFVETVVRDRFTRKRKREVAWREISERAWVRIEALASLWFLDLRRDGCVKLGAPSDAVNARHHAAGRALGGAIYADHPDIDGLLFASRLTGADVYAVFDRAIEKLTAIDPGPLALHPELPSVLTNSTVISSKPTGRP